MKKLLTILVSAASACFAFADGFTESGTSFESYQLGETGFAELKLSDQDDGKRYWLSGANSDFGIVTNYQPDTAIPPGITRPTKFASDPNNKYLRLDTSDTLFRTINSYDASEATESTEAVITTNAVNIGGGIYFDSLVQFTATEDDVTHTAGDKLVVWLKAVDTVPAEGENEEVPGYTNLIITAGNGKAADGTANATNFVASGVNIAPNSWHRLTIKAFYEESSDSTFFNVYIDGGLVSGVLEGEQPVTKFESLVATGMIAYNTISGVGFKGNGAVDDLAFTTSDPLVQTFPLTITAPENCTIAGCLVNDEVIESESNTYLVDVKAENVKVAVVVPAGYTVTNEGATFEDSTWFIPVDITGATANTPRTFNVTIAQNEVPVAKPFSITIGDKTDTYETLADAIAAATAGDTIVVAQGADGATSYNIEGIKIEKSIIINLNGNTLVLNKPAVGATEATQTLGIRIEGLEKSLIDVTIMNGEIEISEANLTKKDETDKQIKMMINNYANLTLDSVILDGTNLVDPANNQPKYVLSNNRGNVLLKGTTSIIVPTTGTSVAFDVCKFQDYVVPTVTLDTIGTIGGDVEVTGGNFVYKAGTIDGAIKFSSGTIKDVAKEDITVVPAGKVLKDDNGVWILVNESDVPEQPTAFTITVTFGTGITGASYKIGEAEAVALASGVASAEIAKDTVVTITAVAADWYKAPEAQTITLDANKEITLEATAVTSENIGTMESDIPAEKKSAVIDYAKSKNATLEQVLAAEYLYADYLLNLDEISVSEPTIEITSITLVDGKPVVEAKVTVGGVTKIKTLTTATLNGTLKYKAAATLDALKTAEPKTAIAYGDKFVQIVVE